MFNELRSDQDRPGSTSASARNAARRNPATPRSPAGRPGRRTNGQLAEACLEALVTPVLLVDDTLRLLFVNASARLLIAEGAGLRIAAERVQLSDAEAQRLLATQVAAVTRSGDLGPSVIMARRRTSPRLLRLAVRRMQLRAPAEAEGAPEFLAALFIDDPDRRPQPDFDTLHELYGVTVAERRLAAALYEGQTIEGAARKFGVSTLTVRTQLKSLFSRMGVHSQSQLVRELGVIAGWSSVHSK